MTEGRGTNARQRSSIFCAVLTHVMGMSPAMAHVLDRHPLQVPYHVSMMRGADDAESVGQMICGKADELRATVIVMAAHNKGRLVRFIVGSTTQYCVRKSHVTVLVMQNN